jgi:DNA polymerase-3 subunit alpha
MPPPPENFPAGWDSEWQPSFEEASIAARPEPVSRTDSPTYTPPRDLESSSSQEAEGINQASLTPVSSEQMKEAAALPQVESIEDQKRSDTKPSSMNSSPTNGGETETATQPVPLEPFHMPSLYVPLIHEEGNREHPPQQITVLLRATGDKERDKRRIKTLHGILISFNGRDKFSFHIYENGKGHLIDFPNDTTRICPELSERLKKLMGEENWRVEEITFQQT